MVRVYYASKKCGPLLGILITRIPRVNGLARIIHNAIGQCVIPAINRMHQCLAINRLDVVNGGAWVIPGHTGKRGIPCIPKYQDTLAAR